MIDSLQLFTEGFLSADSLASHLLLLLMISIFFNLFYFHKSTSSRKKTVKNNSPESIIKNFLDDQCDKTKRSPRHLKRKFIEKSVVRFRSAYLAIESKCLDKGVDTENYWKNINESISRLLEILTDKKSGGLLKQISEKINLIKIELQKSPESDAKIATLKSLDKLYLACVDNQGNPEKLSHFSEKLSELYTKLRDSHYKYAANMSHSTNQYLDTSATTVGKLNHSVQNLSKSHKTLKKLPKFMNLDALESIQAGNIKLKKGVKSLGQDISNAKDSLESISTRILASHSHEKTKSINDEINDISDEILAANDREITRLRDVIKDQKGTIKDLEHSLHALESASSESTDTDLESDDLQLATTADNEIGLLRKNLREAEQCITILESELDSLKIQKNVHLERLEKEDETSITEAEIDTLKSSISNLQEEISSQTDIIKRNKIILDFFLESAEAMTVEDLSVLIYQCCNDLDLNPQLLINTQSRVLELCSIGAVPEREKRLIKSLQQGEVSASATGNKLYFKNKNISGLIQKNNLEAIESDDKKEYIKLFTAIDRLVQNVSQGQKQWQHKRSLNEISNSVKMLAGEIDIAIDGLLNHSEGVIKDGFGQLQDVGRSVGLKANQIAGIKKLESSAITELGGETRVKLRLRKATLGILKKIEAAED